MCLDLYGLKSLSWGWTPFKRRCFGWAAIPWALSRNMKYPGLCWTWGQTSSKMDSFYMLLLVRCSALWATTECCFCNAAPHRKVLVWPVTHAPVPTVQVPCWPVSLPTIRQSSPAVTSSLSESKWPSWSLLTSGTLWTPQREEDKRNASIPSSWEAPDRDEHL